MSGATPSAPVPPPAIPANVAWLGLLGTGIGALVGNLSAQMHSLAAGDLGGGFGLSADEASWIQSAGAAAEVAAVLLASPLAAALGTARVLCTASLVVGALALALRVAPPEVALVLRVVQGFACGLLPVVMMYWAMRAFPPPKRGAALMLFAAASSVPTALAPLLSGWFTAHAGGRGVFVFDVAWAIPVAWLGWLLLPAERADPGRLRSFDWVGWTLVTAAGVALVIVMSQGERRFWGATPWVPALGTAAALLAAASVVWLLTTRRTPMFDLTLLLKPTFAIGLSEALSLRFGLLLASFAVPQALLRLDGFRPEQSGEAILWMLLGHAVGFPLALVWIARRDPRWTMATGFAAFAVASFLASRVAPDWGGQQFIPALAMAGLGQGLFLTSIMTFATHQVPAPAGMTAAGLFNLTRVLGTASAAGLVGLALRLRENFHSAELVSGITAANPNAANFLGMMGGVYGRLTADAAAPSHAALGGIVGRAATQAYALAFGDVFLSIAAVLAVFAVLVPLLPRLPSFREN